MPDALVVSSPKVSFTPIGLIVHEELTYDEWDAIGMKIAPAAKSIGFLVGDWINYGAARYGEKYLDATRATGLTEATLMVYSHVASRIEILSRNKNLDFTHHKVVAKIKDPEEQRRWLDLADSDKMSERRLRKSINAGRHITVEEQDQAADEAETDRGQTFYLASLLELRRWWAREIDKTPLKKWPAERRAHLKLEFKFLVDIYEAL